jgi:hypothetical protein
MTHNLSSVTGPHDSDFTPRTAFVGPVRGLSIQRPRKHQRDYIEATKLLMRTASRIETLQMRQST